MRQGARGRAEQRVARGTRGSARARRRSFAGNRWLDAAAHARECRGARAQPDRNRVRGPRARNGSDRRAVSPRYRSSSVGASAREETDPESRDGTASHNCRGAIAQRAGRDRESEAIVSGGGDLANLIERDARPKRFHLCVRACFGEQRQHGSRCVEWNASDSAAGARASTAADGPRADAFCASRCRRGARAFGAGASR